MAEPKTITTAGALRMPPSIGAVRRPTVLLVEPSELNAHAMTRWLALRGWDAICVGSSSAALASLHGASREAALPDAVLTTWRFVEAVDVLDLADQLEVPAKILSGAPPEPGFRSRWILKVDLGALEDFLREVRP